MSKDEKTQNLSEWSDEALAEALQQGEEAAFDVLVRRYQSRVFAVAWRIVRNREDALDVAQEALVKAYQRIDAWKPTGRFLPWLLRLTSNHAIDYYRYAQRRMHIRVQEVSPDQPEYHAVESETQSAGHQVQAMEIEERLREVLPRLSETQRTAFMLRHYEGQSLSDIAASIGCTVGSVKVHLFRAMKKLKKEMEDFR